MSVGFTGTKIGTTRAQHISLVELLGKLRAEHEEFHHGDCEGADVQAAKIANWYHYRIVSHPPDSPKHRGWFQFDNEIRATAPYIERDQDIVDDTQVLIACPHTPYEITRSGTWTTVRYARSLNRPIYIIKPDGSIDQENLD